jgi:hypothetical protein
LAIERLASRFGPNPSSPKANEELIVAVACQECTQTQGFTLKANKKTEADSARCRAVTFGVWKCHYPCIDPVCFVWLERAPGRVSQEKISGKIDISNFGVNCFAK